MNHFWFGNAVFLLVALLLFICCCFSTNFLLLLILEQLEEGQVKMQSRLEEEEEAKAALMSRIQRLTKLILVSSKNTIPGCLNDVPSQQRRRSFGEDDVSFHSQVDCENEIHGSNIIIAEKSWVFG